MQRATMFFAFVAIAGIFAGQNSELFRFVCAILIAYEASDIVRDKFRAMAQWHWLGQLGVWLIVGGLFFVAAASLLGVLLSGPDIPR
jgi:hypothetical protein